MTIVVECPHCESRYNLQPDMSGKTMRCPNGDCREIFTVQPVDPPKPVTPVVAEITNAQVDEPLVPILEGESAEPETVSQSQEELVPVLIDEPPPLPLETTDDEPLVPILEGEAETPAEPELQPILDLEETSLGNLADLLPPSSAKDRPSAKQPNQNGPQVVDWRKNAPPPQPEPEPLKSIRRSASRDEESEEDFGIKPRRNYGPWKWVLLGLIFSICGLIVFSIVQHFLNEARKERMLVEQADKEFKNQGYTEAKKLYDQLQVEFPASEDLQKYIFFGKLSDVHTTVSTVIIRENPADGQMKFEEFLKEYGDSPLAKPTDTGYGFDVFEAGRKVVDAYADNAEWNHKNFLPKRIQRDKLDEAEQSVEAGRKLIPLVEKYRIRDVRPLDDQRKRFEDLTAILARERERLSVIDPFRDLATEPTDQRIATFVLALKQHRLDTDSEAQQLITDAKAELRRLIRGVIDLRQPMSIPTSLSGGLFFVSSPLGQSTLPVIVSPDAIPEVFFALARGILYAFDPPSGNLLWATRLGRNIQELPVRIPERPGVPELVLLPMEWNGYGLAARVARTGEPKWYQPLEAPIAGKPIVVNQRVYLPLRDELGTIVEIDTSTGNRLSHIQLRQRIGPGGTRQPGSGMIFIAAEARRVFAINTEPFDREGNRLPVRCVQVMATDHPELSLRVPPVITGPAGESRTNRYLILAQADGTQSTKLRGFPIVPAESFDPAVGPPEFTPPLAGSVSIAGHVQFPPYTDGERVAVVTDAGAFGLFGTNQPGNLDANIYAIPSPQLPADPQSPVSGLVISSEEDTFWALSRSQLYLLRLGVSPQAGLRVSTSGLPIPAGIPLHIPQLNAAREIAFLVVRSDDSDGVRAIAFDPRDGRPRWQRKLGITMTGLPIPIDSQNLLVADEDGGSYRIPNAAVESFTKKTEVIDSAWVVQSPTADPRSPARICHSADGQTIWIAVIENGENNSFQLRIRRLANGKAAADERVQIADRFAGPIVATGKGIIIPCLDGFLYRFEPGAIKLSQGPMWRGEGASGSEPCFVTAFSNSEFLTTDGGSRVTRWRWESGSDWKAVAGPWTIREKIPFAPILVSLSAQENRLFIPDPAGNVWMYDGDRVGEPIRRWRASPEDLENSIPAGRPTNGFVVGQTPAGLVITYSVDHRHIVALSPNSEQAIWVVRRLGAPDTLGAIAYDKAFIFTDTSGGVVAYDQITGERIGAIRSENADLLPRRPAQPVGDGKNLLIALWDGSILVLPNPTQ